MIFADFASAHSYTLCILYVIHFMGMSILLSEFNPFAIRFVIVIEFISPNSYFRHYFSDMILLRMHCYIRFDRRYRT